MYNVQERVYRINSKYLPRSWVDFRGSMTSNSIFINILKYLLVSPQIFSKANFQYLFRMLHFYRIHSLINFRFLVPQLLPVAQMITLKEKIHLKIISYQQIMETLIGEILIRYLRKLIMFWLISRVPYLQVFQACPGNLMSK